MRRERSSMHSMRSGIATPMSSPPAVSGRPTVTSADCVAKAFGVPIDTDPRALAILHEWVKTTGAEMNEARLRLTRIPKGADLILNKVSGAPGFWIGNVIVMAGVPSIMQAMLDEVAPKLKIGVRMLSETLRADAREGDIGMQLGEIAKANPGVAIGSYPFFDPQHGPNTNVVLRAPRCTEARAGQTSGRGDAGASAAGTIKERLSLALSRRNRGSSPTPATGSRTQFACGGSRIDALLEQVASRRIAFIAASAVVFFASVQAQAQQARMSYVFETKHSASLATERPRSP